MIIQGDSSLITDKQVVPIVIFVLLFGFFLLIVILVTIIKRARAQERTRQLQKAASDLGLTFVETMPLESIPNLEKFLLFNQGHSKSIRNMMSGQIDGVKATVFDYQYTTGGGKNSTTYHQSVAYFELPEVNLPYFSLRPEYPIHKLMSAFGYQDIDFGNHPEFSRKYLLRGPDEQAVRNTFSDAMLAYYERDQITCTDGGGHQLFVFRHNQRATPQQIRGLITWAAAVRNVFAHRW
jgi:hypothetical protein